MSDIPSRCTFFIFYRRILYSSAGFPSMKATFLGLLLLNLLGPRVTKMHWHFKIEKLAWRE